MRLFVIAVWLFSIVGSLPSFAAFDKVSDYIKWYGSISPSEDDQVAKVHQIFERVRNMADKNSQFRRPELVVLKNVSTEFWAEALPDGNIVLWKAAIDTIFQPANSPNQEIEAEARIAFILGHELGHLASDDYGFLKRYPKNATQQRRSRELAADKKGYAYAALSGYQVHLLLKKTSNNKNFLEQWLKRPTEIYPPIDMSVAEFQDYLYKIQYKITFFEFGVRLSHFERCNDAVSLLLEFKQVFPAREVFNNLGYCYLQLARQEMDNVHADFYWMPQILDAETLAAAIVRGEEEVKTLKQAARFLSKSATEWLKKAEAVLKQAEAADLDYYPARVNLAVTYLYLGKPFEARRWIDEAYLLAPKNLEIQGLRTVIFYEQSGNGLDIWSSAIAPLKKRAAKWNAPPSLIYNLARLLDIRASKTFSKDAQPYWKRLDRMADRLPKPIRAIVCRQPNLVCDTKPSRHQPPRWKWPISFDELQDFSKHRATLKNQIGDWEEAIPINFWPNNQFGHIYQHPHGRAEILELNDYVQLQILKGSNLGSVNQLSNYCGQPLRQRALARGDLWSCGNWAALTFDGQKVLEVWQVVR